MKKVAVLTAHERLGLRPGDFPWYHFVARSGELGERWAQEFEAYNGADMTTMIDRALSYLRQRRHEEGRELLHQSAERLEALRASAWTPVVSVLERYHHSANAYLRYLDDDFEGAEHEFDIAVRSICQTIEEIPSFVILANHCYDFLMQRARIARNQGLWAVMRNHIEASREMVENRRPLCVLEDRKPIFIEDVDFFHRTFEPQDEEERAALAELLDTKRRRQLFELTVHDNYVVPGMVIPYRPSRLVVAAP